MQIEIGKGIGDFIFGQYEREIVEIHGKPNKKYIDEYGDIFLKYNSMETTLKFEHENEFRLSWIETSNIKMKILDFSPWKILKADLLPKLTELLSEPPQMEDYGSFESVTYNNSWMEFQFEYGLLKQINFGVLLDSDSKAKWPTV